MSVDIENIGSPCAEPVAGFVPKLYWAPRADFQTLVDPKDICDEDGNGADTYEELAEITDSHVMKTGKKLHTVDFVTETGELKHTTIGESKIYQNEMKVTLEGSSAKVLGYSRFIKRQKAVFFVEEQGSGRFRQLGSSRINATVSVEGGLDASTEGNNSMILTITDKQKWPSPIYSGDMDIAADSE